MGMTIDGSQYFGSSYTGNLSVSDQSASSQALENKLSGLKTDTADDEELMDACKGFEAYFVEQVFKEMMKTVKPDGEDNKYLEYFGDMMVEDLANNVVETQGFGIAQTLYESMKRNQV